MDNNNTENKTNNQNSNANNNSGNISQSGFLDNILQKDNENNKLFLKIVFWLTAAASVILLYTGIKGLSLYLNAKKAASEASSGCLVVVQIYWKKGWISFQQLKQCKGF